MAFDVPCIGMLDYEPLNKSTWLQALFQNLSNSRNVSKKF